MKTILERVSLAPTEASVNSPVPVAPKPQLKRAALVNTDNPLAPTVKAVQMQAAMKEVNRVVTAPPNLVRSSSPPVVPPSKLKKFLMGTGIFLSTFGIVGGFISIVAFGPIGLAIAGGAAILAAGMIWAGGKVK